MVDSSLPYDEIAVVIVPASLLTTAIRMVGVTGEETYEIRTYDALIYTSTEIEGLRPIDAEESVQWRRIGNLALAGKEQVVVNWTSYQTYILKFFFGEQNARTFLRHLVGPTSTTGGANELFQVKGDFLKALFDGKLPRNRETRIWWHSELPEVVALPWELLAYQNINESEPSFSFLRGLPPQTNMPRVPISGPLRLAFIHEPRITSRALLDVFAKPPPTIEVTHMTGPPREALLTAARKGYEIVHLVTDGTVSLANDGTLYLRKGVKPRPDRSALTYQILRGFLHVYNFMRPRLTGIAHWIDINQDLSGLLLKVYNFFRTLMTEVVDWIDRKVESELDIDKCSPSELSSLILGSRISILSFSAPTSNTTEKEWIAGYLLPKVYRAFCSLGSSSLPLPTIVAPVGATDDPEMTKFWQGFYSGLGEHGDTLKAMAAGLKGQSSLAMALFQRHSESRVFTQISADQQTKIVDPTQVVAALQISEQLVQQLKAQFGKYSAMPESFKGLLLREIERQERLKTELEPWIETGRDTSYE